LERGHVDRMVAAKWTTPAAARNFLKTLHALMEYAIALKMRKDDPTVGVKRPEIKGEGFKTWDESHIAIYGEHHAIGTRARLALELLLNVGSRRGDVVGLGRQHVRDGEFTYIGQERRERWSSVCPCCRSWRKHLPPWQATISPS
jgi:site-specific recombinase XerD